MKRMLKWLGYVVMASQIFTLSIPLIDTVIAGYTLKYLLFYLLIFATNAMWITKKIIAGMVTIREMFVLTLLVCPILFGLAWGWPLGTVLLEGIHMMMPIVIYQWVDLIDIEREEYTKFFAWVSIAAGVVSALVALGVIDADIWTKEGDYTRAAGAVDSTIGITGFCVAVVLLYVYPWKNKKGKVLLLAMLLASILTTVFSQSRTRIVLIAGIVAVVVLCSMFNSKSNYGTLRILGLAIVLAVVVVYVFPQVTEQIMAQVTDRFEQIGGEDMNINYRQLEAENQLRSFAESPIVGKGWGSRSAYDNMYFHNIYTTLLMHGGLIFGGGYILWFASYFVKAVQNWYRKRSTDSAMVCTLIVLSLLILGFTNGGFMQSGGYLAMAYVFLDEKCRRRKMAG